MPPPPLASSSTQSPSDRRQRRQRRPNSASLMARLPGNIVTARDSTLSKCAATCHNAAGAAVCPDLATTCQCTNANFRSDFLSCVEGECQAAELGNAQQFLAGLSCGTVSLTTKPTSTVPFLPTNANADINEPSHTSVTPSSSSSSVRNTSQETGSPNTGSTQTVDRNGAPAGVIAASVILAVLIVALVIFVWWWIRRRRQQIRERSSPAQFLESASPVQRVERSPSMIKVAVAMDVETQAEVTRTNELVLDEAQSEKGAPARNQNLRLVNFSDLPAEENTALANNAQDVAHTEDAVTVRLRRVEAQLAALLTPAVASPEELPPSYWG
ncbi:hypothetical protein C8R45DRAFT_1015387 [Mycena sanguinolenta]|nr:hypothetical protein C8R45DRAFT_1015387 [Mycena sanguinolenta]